jgi:hypothetical protein
LATSANSIRGLDANRAEFKQFPARQQSVFLSENADAIQHDTGDARGNSARPACGRMRRAIE